MITTEIQTTELSDSISNLCRDYSSFIVWSTGKITQLKDRGWSDLSISEPDTLTLSEISSMHDYVQLAIDNMYVNTNPEVSSDRFFHQLSSTMGNYLIDHQPHQVQVKLTNFSEVPIIIPAYSPFSINNLLLTNPLPIEIYPLSTTSSYLVIGSQLVKIYPTSQLKIGEIYLQEALEESSLSVSGVTLDGTTEIINSQPNIIDLITSDNYTYQLSYKGDNLYRVKLSPKCINSYQSIIINYSLINKQNIAQGVVVNYIDSRVEVSIMQDAIYEEYTRNQNLISYYKSLTQIKLFDTTTESIDFSPLQGKIIWSKAQYLVNITNTRLRISLITYEDRPLLGSGQIDSQYLRRMNLVNSSSASSYSLYLEFIFRPPYPLQIYYKNYTIDLPNNALEINLPLTNYELGNDLYLGNSNIGKMFKYNGIDSFETIRTEMDVFYEILNQIYPEYYELPVFGISPNLRDNLFLLSPLYLDLNCQVITSQPSTIVSDIVSTINKYLFDGEVLTSSSVSYPQITSLLLKHIPTLQVIKFDSKLSRIAIGFGKYLKLNTIQNYESQIRIVGAIS